MKYNIFLLFLEILYNLYNIISVKALIGENIKKISGDQEFLAVVAISYINYTNSPEDNIFCTGTLISQSNILTCEHCFDKTLNLPYVIIAESNDVRMGKTFYPSWWMSYDQWCITRRIRITEPDNDIAVIKIFLHVNLNIIPFIRSEINRNSYYFGRVGVTVGWGTINNNVIPTNLYAGNLTIITNIECINTIERIQHQRILVPAKFVCSKAEPYLLSAPGDSGSPLIVDGILIAITKGATPNMQGFHPYRANAHLTVQRYNNYIETLVSTY